MDTMNMFKRKSQQSDPTLSFIGRGVNFVGSIRFEGEFVIQGKVQGDIATGVKLIIGEDGEFTGQVNVEELYLDGCVNGDVTVRNTAHLHRNSRLEGALEAMHLSVEEGAVINGEVTMSGPQATGVPNNVVALDNASNA